MNQNKFSTHDLNLATVLITLGYKISKIDKSNSKKAKFIFEAKDGLGQIINDYWDNKIDLPAQDLFNSQKMLKNRLFSNL